MARHGKMLKNSAKHFLRSNSKLKALYKIVDFPDKTLAKFIVSEYIDW